MKRIIFISLSCLIFCKPNAQELSVHYKPIAGDFLIADKGKTASLVIDPSDYKVVSIAGKALQEDISDISGHNPDITNSLPAYPVFIGTIGHSKWIDSLIGLKKIAVDQIKDHWESFSIEVVQHPFKNVAQAVVITGADRRGTAFGVFELSKLLGVSPLKWWADVSPEKHSSLFLQPGKLIQKSPSVKFRGIFINDEDWGIQPWAAKNMDTDIKDIGPKTYTKVFELLLRLKANYLWPAMHPCTKAFYYYSDDPKIADDYGIVIGSSHCEPMLRNNVFEWAENYENEYGKKPGEWRYDLNKNQIYNYWKDRVAISKNYESVYTVGMRGIHDGSMPGPKSIPEKVQLLQQIISDQRNLLDSGSLHSSMQQIFCPYKEVLDVYRRGVQLPDDVTIVWSDDNHGYIRQLSNEAEQKRSGGSGIYYHLSYWGSPHDYLWLSSLSPSLISYEMTKAYRYGANRLWVFNVGDIKPAEMEIQFTMDLAWNVDQWPPEKAIQYAEKWAAQTFGKKYANEIARIKNEYYRLAASGKPEHLGTLKFSPAEEKERLAKYNQIADAAAELLKKIPDRLKDAYFELIYYPVVGAQLMNEKILYAHWSLDPALSADAALDYANRSSNAFQQIQELTDEYNHVVADGKWDGIMSWHPRDLPVFFLPKMADKRYTDSIHLLSIASKKLEEAKNTIKIAAENFNSKKENATAHFQLVKGLGITGNAMTTLPFNQKLSYDSTMTGVPFLEYKINLTEGNRLFKLKCLPTQSTDDDGKLFYAISVNGEKPRMVNIHSESESAQWKQNVLRGYAEGRSAHLISKAGASVIRIYFPDPGLAVNLIEIE
jgi:hypothetical protein